MRLKLAFAAAAAALAAVVALAQPTPPPEAYLPGDRAPDTSAILPPAPAPGSPRDKADRAIFKATRALKGTPRWELAIRDVAATVPDMEKAFGCATGLDLTPQSAPRLTAMMTRIARDSGTAMDRPKKLYQRRRPYLVDKGEICVAEDGVLSKTWDYPSGHATWGWAWGLILAEVDPPRQSQILARARAFGESRAVCGVHSASAVDAGRTDGAALVAALHGDPAFRADLEAVRAELQALGAHASAPSAACDVEAGLIAKTPW